MADYIPPHDASDPNLPEEPMPLGLVLGLTGAVFGGTILLLVVAYIVVSYKERKEKKLRERQDEETGEGEFNVKLAELELERTNSNISNASSRGPLPAYSTHGGTNVA